MRKRHYYNKYRIDGLYRRRELLANQLDRAYIKGNISSYLALEDRYRKLSMLIEAISRRETTQAKVGV